MVSDRNILLKINCCHFLINIPITYKKVSEIIFFYNDYLEKLMAVPRHHDLPLHIQRRKLNISLNLEVLQLV